MRQSLHPMLACEDGAAAMDFLIAALGFVEKERWLDGKGRPVHGEPELNGSSLYPAEAGPACQRPRRVRSA